MNSPTLPMEFAFIAPAVTERTESPISPSRQPLPAEHPSHSRTNSKETASASSKTATPPNLTPKLRQGPTRSKSSSLSFPVLASNATISNIQTISQDSKARPPKRPGNGLRITVPSAAHDSSFLTTLAAQERRVLELKEELGKAEESLTNLKKQWSSYESRRRDSESKKLHRMKPLQTDGPPTPRFPSYAGGTTTPRAMFEEMQRRKVSTDHIKPSPRRRRFSGSRQMRALSLVSPDTLKKFAELSELERKEKVVRVQSPILVDSPNPQPPTPDLIHEEDEEDNETGTTSPSSQSPQHRRHTVRSSMQMAADFREGLWTFFEDLKQATYGEEARGPGNRPRQGSRSDALARKDRTSSTSNSASGRPKRTVRRQTWQIRPRDSNEALVDVGGHNYKVAAAQDVSPISTRPVLNRSSTQVDETTYHQQPRPNYPPPAPPKDTTGSTSQPSVTPQKPPRYEKDTNGETWPTWDTPRSASVSSTATVSQIQPSSTDAKSDKPDPLRRKPVPTEGRRGSLPWPALHKLRPTQLTRTASHLMDEWEKSLSPPLAWDQVQQIQRAEGNHSPRPVSPRPASQRSNSRLDASYA